MTMTALAKAISLNRDTIVHLLAADGPQDIEQIKRYCAEQAYADDLSINMAITELLGDDLIRQDPDDLAFELVE